MGKILILDDDLNVRDQCYEVLTQEGHHVVTCPVSGKMVDLIQQEKPDLILFDAPAFGERGISLLQLFSGAADRKVPVVIFSAPLSSDWEKKVYAAGAIEVMMKDTEPTLFCAQLQKILNTKHRLFNEPQENAGFKILVVDDESEIRDFLSDFFVSKGFRVFTASNGEQALLLVQKERPSAILLDITMPGMDGILTLKKLRKIDSKVGVVIATSVHDEKIMKQTIELGAYAYVLKPFDLQYLELVVVSRLMIAGAPPA